MSWRPWRNGQALEVPAPAAAPPLSPAAGGAAGGAWGALIPEGPVACALLRERYLLGPHRTVHVGRTVNVQRALSLPLQQGAWRVVWHEVSCAHLSITCAGPGTWLLIDDSTNGTWVDGVRAPRGCPMALRPGCLLCLCAGDITFEKTVAFRFVVFDGAAVGAAAAGAAAFGIGEAAGAALGAATTLLMRPDAAATAAAATAAAAAGSAAWQPDDREAPATQCAVCWNAHVRVLLLPCAHLCICAACDAGLVRRLCPLCREPISASINARFP